MNIADYVTNEKPIFNYFSYNNIKKVNFDPATNNLRGQRYCALDIIKGKNNKYEVLISQPGSYHHSIFDDYATIATIVLYRLQQAELIKHKSQDVRFYFIAFTDSLDLNNNERKIYSVNMKFNGLEFIKPTINEIKHDISPFDLTDIFN